VHDKAGRLSPGDSPSMQKLLEAGETERKLLEERVRNLESIVCSVDLELNARLTQLAQSAAAARPGHLAAGGLRPSLALVPTLPPILPGQVLVSRYHIERELGRGGMGAVFLARDAQLGELVALKVISAHLAGEAVAAAERFRREASAARKITHRNVIRIH